MITETEIKKLEAAGWTVGTVEEFLQMTDQEIRAFKAVLAMRDILGTLRRAITWSETGQDAFLGETAWTLCATEEGFKLVMDEIARIEGGVY